MSAWPLAIDSARVSRSKKGGGAAWAGSAASGSPPTWTQAIASTCFPPSSATWFSPATSAPGGRSTVASCQPRAIFAEPIAAPLTAMATVPGAAACTASATEPLGRAASSSRSGTVITPRRRSSETRTPARRRRSCHPIFSPPGRA